VVFVDIDALAVGPDAQVYEEGWQSWSPTTLYPASGAATAGQLIPSGAATAGQLIPSGAATAGQLRPSGTSARPIGGPDRQAIAYRPGKPAPAHGFQGEGLLGVVDGSSAWLYSPTPGSDGVPSIRASLVDGRLSISADGPVVRASGSSLAELLASFASSYAGGLSFRPAPTVWCSWYHYFTRVTESDVVENLVALGKHDLPVDVVQIDDGWESQIGDWLTLSSRFKSLSDLVMRIGDTGRRAGIWVAPFLATADSDTARTHPDWVVPGAGFNWGQPLLGLDPTHPGVRGYLTEVFERLRGYGFDYFKVDFLYAGALGDLSAYRSGVSLIRDVIGPDAYLLGCGAPILPSVGLFDAMRVSADVAPAYAPPDGDPSQPSQYGATLSTVARAWQHGRFWVNDPDCIIVRPEVERREEWAAVVERYGGLRASSDRIAALDDWGLETTRHLLSTTPPPTPF
jgi:alpha-galactosidase